MIAFSCHQCWGIIIPTSRSLQFSSSLYGAFHLGLSDLIGDSCGICWSAEVFPLLHSFRSERLAGLLVLLETCGTDETADQDIPRMDSIDGFFPLLACVIELCFFRSSVQSLTSIVYNHTFMGSHSPNLNCNSEFPKSLEIWKYKRHCR